MRMRNCWSYIEKYKVYMKCSFAKTDKSVFNNSQKSCFFIVHYN